MRFLHLLTLLVFSGSALGSCPTKRRAKSQGKHLTAGILVEIMPLSSSCEGRGGECRTAEQALPYFNKAMSKYNTTLDVEKAGILALVGFESADMQYKRNQNNAANGQGTSNQQMGEWNVQYANSMPELKSLGLTETTVLDHVIEDKYNFGTGPWYYSTQCAAAHAVAGGPVDDWFNAYMACVHTDVGPRLEYWYRAKKAFGLA